MMRKSDQSNAAQSVILRRDGPESGSRSWERNARRSRCGSGARSAKSRFADWLTPFEVFWVVALDPNGSST